MKSEICKTELTLNNLFDLGGSMQKNIYTGYNAGNYNVTIRGKY